MNGNVPLQNMPTGEDISRMLLDVAQDISATLGAAQVIGQVIAPDECAEVPHESVSGFVPFTDGGYTCMTFADIQTMTLYTEKPCAAHWPQDLRDTIKNTFHSTFLECVNYARQQSGKPAIATFGEAAYLFENGQDYGTVPGLANWQPLPGMPDLPHVQKEAVREWSEGEQYSFEAAEMDAYASSSASLYGVRVRCYYYQAAPSFAPENMHGMPVCSFCLSVNRDFEYYRESETYLGKLEYPLLEQWAPLANLDGPALETIKQNMLNAFFKA